MHVEHYDNPTPLPSGPNTKHWGKATLKQTASNPFKNVNQPKTDSLGSNSIHNSVRS